MSAPPELEPVSPRVSIWHAYDSAVKADLFSTALFTPHRTYLVDPIELNPEDLHQLVTTRPTPSIVVTNQNHWRGSTTLAQHFSLPIFAHPGAGSARIQAHFSALTPVEFLGSGLELVPIDGAAPGEIALISTLDSGVLIVGDALINFEPYGFTLLPPKYCTDQKTMRTSLGQLLRHDFEQIFFAHGFPLLANGRARLEALLKSA